MEEHINSGHFGAEKCSRYLTKYYYWPKMRRSIRVIIAGCEHCQKSKISKTCRGEMHSVLPDASNKVLCIDLIGPLPQSQAGATILLVAIDAFSKLVRLFPLK